jgi:predicted ArsR family transcriptional regulator
MANELDQVIHQPIRTKIMALLLNSGECDYSTIKNTLNISDGHMSTHMKVLVSEEYVEMEKTFVDNKPKTTYKVTKNGKKKFSEYVDTLRKIVSIKP